MNGLKNMKKLLIYMHEGDLTPTGGPRGYNYNLLQGFKEIGLPDSSGEIEICYLPGTSSSLATNDKVKKIKNRHIRNFVNAVKSIAKKGMMMYGPRHTASVDLNQYDAVHFHITMDMYWVKDSLKDYKGKVLLTSHTPTTPSKEIWDNLTDFEKKYMKWFYKRLPAIEEYDFDHADYIIFPCPEAEEPYYHEWNGYDKVHERNAKKYLYIPTGTGEKDAPVDRSVIRKQYGIPEDAFVVAYVGRHNEIKGYDKLQQIAREVLKKQENVYFLIAGREGPLYHLENEHWIEGGWTKDPGSIIKASDVFILPNRETYFDLVVLEVLSIGQILLATDTGGNKYFRKFDNSGIILYETVADAVAQIEKLMDTSGELLEKMRQRNKKLYQDNFTNRIFAENYLRLVSTILE